ncbi:chorismate synthase [Bdellovibrio bacteriovorus]|uniref:Chorismate synthase n=1 Tax=Bdellovibrio bacteriovorus str. Tiberius TaxID=1069642 RepID=K7Z1W3_BDEBC|nr:chorismate synthase [Bdellovibrio bacteriovorus]AFY03075.1 chorismate synthase [Bdellovibrio bacteriovorus str. Tiberius]
MSASQFGSRFVITTFGESHGTALGVVIDGCPAGVNFDEGLLRKELERRRPGHHGSGQVVSGRQETDAPEVLSGVFDGKTLGTPMAIIVRNQDARSQDYSAIKNSPRAGHADDMWKNKFGHSDHRGGGRSSGRETVSRVMAGSVAQMMMKHVSAPTKVIGYASQIGPMTLTDAERKEVSKKDIDSFQARFPSSRDQEVADLLKEAQDNGESHGGVAEILIQNPPAHLGQPVFHKLKSDLAMAFLSVGATNGFELGLGFESAEVKGTEFHQGPQDAYGGIRGGISTGESILLRVSFKPTSSILDVAKKGRHDPCIVTRAIPVLEAMTWLVLADHYLWSKTDRI